MQRALSPTFAKSSAWPAAGVGVVLVAAAAIVLVDVAMVAHFSARLIAWTAIITGAFEVFIALFRRPWSGLAPRALLGVFYMAFGFAFLQHAEFRSAVLIYVLAASLVGSGIVRLFLGFAGQARTAWFVLSGAVGVAAGLAILFGWVGTTNRAIGLLLGGDLLLHGIAWLAWARASPRDEALDYR